MVSNHKNRVNNPNSNNKKYNNQNNNNKKPETHNNYNQIDKNKNHRSGGRKGIYCYICGSRFHISPNCPDKDQQYESKSSNVQFKDLIESEMGEETEEQNSHNSYHQVGFCSVQVQNHCTIIKEH